MAGEQFILVAGHDYAGHGLNFRVIADTRMKLLLQAFPDATVTIFDVRAGEVFKSWQPPNVSKKKKKKPKRKTSSDTTTFKPVTKKNYSGKDPDHPTTFDTDPKGILSITDIYAAVIALGAAKATKGKLLELSVFSHGWYGGAILVNSRDTSPNRKRAPDDKDTRLFDFDSANFSKKQLADFAAAFSADGVSHLWGCSFAHMYFLVVNKVVRSSKYRKAKPGSLKDTDTFELDFTREQAEDFFEEDKTFFPQPKEVTDAKTKKKVKKWTLTFTRTLKQIKAYLRSGIQDTYAQLVATTTQHRCFCAYLGTYADFESNDPKVKNPLMRIPIKSPPYADDFTREIEFYKTVLKIAEDPESRGYATYSP